MRLIRNGLYSVGTHGSAILIYLIATPFIIRRMGVDAYGIYTITSLFAGYLTLFDLGLSNAIIRALGEAYAQRDTGRMRKVMCTSAVSYLALGLLLGCVFAASTPLVVDHFLRIPRALHEVALATFYLAAVNLALSIFSVVFPAAITALQRYDLFFWRNLTFSAVNVVGTIIILWTGHDLRAIMGFNVAMSAVGLAVWYQLYRGLLPDVPLRLVFDAATFRALLRYGLLKIVSSLANYIIPYTDRLAIGYFLPISAVAYYAVPSSIGQKLSGLQIAFLPLFPAMVEQQATGQVETLRRLYIKSTRYLALLMLPAAGFLFVFADRVLLYWVGPAFVAHCTLALRLLILAYLLQALSATSSIIVDALGRPGVQSVFLGCSCLTNVALIVALTPMYGIEGAALAFLLNTVAQSISFVLYVCRKIARMSLARMLQEGFGRPALAAVGASVSTAMLRTVGGDGLPPTVLCGVFYVLCYAVFCVVVRAVERQEIGRVRGWMAMKLARAGRA